MQKVRIPDRDSFITILRYIGKLLPGDFLKTFVYLHLIAAPRKALRKYVGSFYRMDLIYDVLKEFNGRHKGPFSILEFGTANGYSFAKMLYATRYLQVEDQVTVHAFDSFEGLLPPRDDEDRGLISNDWKEGQYRGSYETLVQWAESRKFKNYQIHRGYFHDSLTQEVIEQLRTQKPILVWVDCDYYHSARTVLERLLPVLLTGSVFYFDDFDFNLGSRFTGEARLVDEVNRGGFGENIELLYDRKLSWESCRVYRFIRFDEDAPQFEQLSIADWEGMPRPISNGSPLP